MFQPVGGMDQAPKALTRAVGTRRVHTGASSAGSPNTGGGVRVTYTQRRSGPKAVEADFCVGAA